MAEEKTEEYKIFEEYLAKSELSEEQKISVNNALAKVESRRINNEKASADGKSLEEQVLDEELANLDLTDDQKSVVFDALVEYERRRLSREASEISENINNLSAEDLETLASTWARTPGADELRAKIAARQEELRSAQPETPAEQDGAETPAGQEGTETPAEQDGAETPAGQEGAETPAGQEGGETPAEQETTGTEKDEIFQEKSAINIYNAVEVSKDLKDLRPSELHTLRRALNAQTNDQTIAAGIKLDDHIVSQAEKYSEGDLPLTDMEEVYALTDLLTLVRDYPRGEKAKTERATLESAIKKSKEEIQAFEEAYGIDKEHLQSPEIVESNIAKLNDLPKDKDIFALDTKPERLQPPTEYRDVVGIINTYTEGKSVPELSVLTGALQCKELNDDQRKTLLDWAETRVKETKKLEHKDFANFDYLLTTLETSGRTTSKSVVSSKRKMLGDARQSYLQSAGLKNKEFQDIYNILGNLQVKGELKAFGREQLEQSGVDSDIAMFLQQTRRETEMYLANTGAVTDEAFNQEYANRLRANLVEVVYADKFSKGEISEKDTEKMFQDLAKAAGSKKGIRINEDAFIGWQAAKANRIGTAVKKEGEKEGYKNVVQALSARVKATDQKLTKKYGKAYSLVKGALKSAGWGAAYGIAGTVAGPAGIAAVSCVSCANQVYGFVKEYRKQRKEATAKGEKAPNFWEYCKTNKLRVAGLFLSSATAVIGVGGINSAAVQVARSSAGIGLAAAGAFHQAAQAYAQTEGSKGKKRWAAIKSFGTSALSFGVGMWAGRAAGELAAEAYNDFRTEHTPSPTTGNEGQSSVIDERWQVNRYDQDGWQNGDTPDVKVPYAPEDQIIAEPPAIDVNNLSAEQAHDIHMLFARSPAEANAILGGEWRSSAALQEAWDNGTITDAQKLQLTEFAGQRFDEHGHFQDVEGYKSATQMEADAKEWQARQDARAAAAQSTTQSRPELEPLEEIDGTRLQAQAGQLKADALERPEIERVSKVEVNRIINEGDEVKIVGTDPNGHRFTVRSDDETLMAEMGGVKKVVFDADGNTKDNQLYNTARDAGIDELLAKQQETTGTAHTTEGTTADAAPATPEGKSAESQTPATPEGKSAESQTPATPEGKSAESQTPVTPEGKSAESQTPANIQQDISNGRPPVEGASLDNFSIEYKSVQYDSRISISDAQGNVVFEQRFVPQFFPNRAALMPELYSMNGVIHYSEDITIDGLGDRFASTEFGVIVGADEVYQELASHETITPGEEAFMKCHEQDLEKWGLTHDNEGKLVRMYANDATYNTDGVIYSFDKDGLKITDNGGLSEIKAEDKVYLHLQKRQKGISHLGISEKQFMEEHEQNLQEKHLTHDEKGRLVKENIWTRIKENTNQQETPNNVAAPEQAANTAPEQAANTAPEQAANTAPEQAANTAPEQAANTAPEQATNTAPEQGTTINGGKLDPSVVQAERQELDVPTAKAEVLYASGLAQKAEQNTAGADIASAQGAEINKEGITPAIVQAEGKKMPEIKAYATNQNEDANKILALRGLKETGPAHPSQSSGGRDLKIDFSKKQDVSRG